MPKRGFFISIVLREGNSTKYFLKCHPDGNCSPCSIDGKINNDRDIKMIILIIILKFYLLITLLIFWV